MRDALRNLLFQFTVKQRVRLIISCYLRVLPDDDDHDDDDRQIDSHREVKATLTYVSYLPTDRQTHTHTGAYERTQRI